MSSGAEGPSHGLSVPLKALRVCCEDRAVAGSLRRMWIVREYLVRFPFEGVYLLFLLLQLNELGAVRYVAGQQCLDDVARIVFS